MSRSISISISEAARQMNQARKVKSGGRNGGRPRDLSKPRCPCGITTLKRAKARGHHC